MDRRGRPVGSSTIASRRDRAFGSALGGLEHSGKNSGRPFSRGIRVQGLMKELAGKAARLEAAAHLGIANVHLVHRYWEQPIDVVGMADEHRLELCLLPPPPTARGCFPDRWGPHRFERIGGLFLVPAQQPLHAKSDCRHQYSLVCSFPPEAMCTWLDEELVWTDSRLQASLDITSPTIRNLLSRLREELRTPGLAGRAMLEALAAQVAIELMRFCHGIGEGRVRGGLAPWMLRRIDERLAQPGPAPSLSELAKLCGLSVRHLSRAFRVSRGHSIGSCIVEASIDQARRALAGGECVKSVAYAMGFNSPSNFSSAFRRATGETPRQYQQRVRSGSIRCSRRGA